MRCLAAGRDDVQQRTRVPPAFLRRCLLRRCRNPATTTWPGWWPRASGRRSRGWGGTLIANFLKRSRERGGLSIDQLLNAFHLAATRTGGDEEGLQNLTEAIWHRLDGTAPAVRPE
ncbi:ATPase OS=Streptomyces glaucescens OX=1907 GN=SGLAU_03305 PE=4 SV=1 [Streptomyces glaucescens]